jgi:hypothetical protein
VYPDSRSETLVENFQKNRNFSQKPSWEQKFFAKSLTKTKIFAFRENDKRGFRFNPTAVAVFTNIVSWKFLLKGVVFTNIVCGNGDASEGRLVMLSMLR